MEASETKGLTCFQNASIVEYFILVTIPLEGKFHCWFFIFVITRKMLIQVKIFAIYDHYNFLCLP